MSLVTMKFAVFLVCVLFLYYIVPKKWQWIVLLGASYYFYLCTGVKNLGFILLTTISTYLFAGLIEKQTIRQKEYLALHKEEMTKDEKKAYKATVKKMQRWLLFVCLAINFGLLIFLKYANWAIAYTNLFRITYLGKTDLIGFLPVFLPLGISFYMFQSMGYLIDIYYGKYNAEKNPFQLALYVSFFPQLIQGPISRFGELSKELYAEHAFEFTRIKSGFYRIMWGLFKKLVIADRLAGYVTSSIEQKETYKGVYLIFTLLFYSFQLYGDFSGGIDVTIGVSEMFGIRLTENFERPFFSKNIAEYWRRWHITLGTWFKDYIFYPLSISKRVLNMGKWVKTHVNDTLGKKLPIYLPMIAVWITTGMWHGSENRYVVWGLMNCLFIMLGTEFEPISKKITEKYHLDDSKLYMKLYRVGKTFILMSFLRVFDLSKNAKDAFVTMKYVFMDLKSFQFTTMFSEFKLTQEDFIVAIIAIVCLTVFGLIQRYGSVREKIFRLPTPVQWVILSALITVVAVFGVYGRGYDAKQFIYLQF